MHPVVSFLLIPNLEHPEYLQACVASILAQTFIDAEILVLDSALAGHPTLLSESQLSENWVNSDSPLRPIRLKEPLNPVDYCNFTIQQVQGTLIWLLPVEHCLASPQVVQDMVTQFILNPQLGLAFCRAQHIDEDGRPYESYTPHKRNTDLPYQPTLYPGRVFFRHLLKGNLIPDGCAVARKQCYLDCGLFEPALADSAAWYNWLRFSLEWDVFFDPSPKVYLRKSRAGLSSKPESSREALEGRYASYQALEAYLKENAYPKTLRRQAHLAKLQFMRRKGFKMSVPQKIMRFYHALTVPRFDLSPA